jgi:hypothetical protein
MSQTLSVEHRKTLEVDSGISPKLIATRGYRTVTGKTELHSLGFPLVQSKVPTLLIPIWGVNGGVVMYQSRPDVPRMSKGRIVKYETPQSSRMVLDIHPDMREIMVNPKVPLWITEGIKKGDSLVSRGCCAIALLGVWNWRGTNEYGGKTALADWEYIALNNRSVYICFDSDVMLKQSVHAALARIAEFLKLRGATVAFVYLPAASGGAKQGVDDYLAEGKTVDDLLALSTTELRVFEHRDSEESAEDRSSADRAVAYITASGADLFHDQLGESFIVYENASGRREIWPLKSKAASNYIRWRFLTAEHKGLTGETMATARGTLAAKAQFEGPEHRLAVRVAQTAEGIWYDLGDWRAVFVSEFGWQVVDKPPILFRHYMHQAVQHEPQLGGTLDNLLSLINLPGDSSRLLLKVYLVAALIPDIAMPVMAACGEQGSAKSTLFRLTRALIDPSNLASLSPPDNLREFVQLAAHHRAVFFDNLSHFPEWLSDAMCRLCTGDGFSKRELFTDDDDIVYTLRGLGGVNGINLVATKPDLLDRTIILRLAAILPERRLSEQALMQKFNAIRPGVLGSMLETLSTAMRLHRTPRSLQELPRMADFALWGMDIAEALGYKANDFLNAYAANVQLQNESALEESPVAQAILAFLSEEKTEWEGTSSDLLLELEGRAQELRINTRSKEWPKGANVLSRRLREVIPGLRRAGTIILEQRTNRTRTWHLTRREAENTVQTVTTVTTEANQPSNGKGQVSSPIAPVSSPEPPVSSPEKAPIERDNDDSDDNDDILPTIKVAPDTHKIRKAEDGEV